MTKGLILAGGKGTRLLPITRIINKHIIPILNKPMIMYPLDTLKYFGIKDIMIVSGGGHMGSIEDFLEDGSDFGVNLTYRVQKNPGGIGEALGLAKDFAGNDPIMVILGDNIFDNSNLNRELPEKIGKENSLLGSWEPADKSLSRMTSSFLFLSEQKENGRFGVPVFNEAGIIVSIEEKPKEPKSNFAVTGLYIYPPNVFDIIPNIKPSHRGEIEITDINNWYIDNNKCGFSIVKGFWSDAGTRESLKQVIDWAYENEKEVIT